MRILVLSDVHANLTALEAVLQAAGSVGGIWCLGDVVGYGPDPNECIERLRDLPDHVCLLGNHDAAVLGQIDLNSFNRDARLSIEWTRSNLKDQNKQYLSSLPKRLEISGITLAHGSPRNPVWEYILDSTTAAQNFKTFQTRLCFIGHTHLPVAFYYANGHSNVSWQLIREGDCPDLAGRAFLNPGSVGQPRDHDPRASFATFETETQQWQLHRVEYAISEVQERIRRAGLPVHHANRLAEGW